MNFESYTTAQAYARMLGFKYTAMDKNKEIFAYAAKPIMENEQWELSIYDNENHKRIGKYVKKRNWKKSLRKL